jgi:Domain of unknown function (DUF4192)
MSTADATPLLRLRTPDDVLAAVPYLLGFHPSESLVVLGMQHTSLVFSVRGDLPAGDAAARGPAAGEAIGREADYLARIFARHEADTVVLVGYGPADRVTPLALAAARRFQAEGIEVADIIRATDGRYWSYTCQSRQCCPPEGTAYDVSGSRIAAEATLAGQVALPDRETLASRLGPPEGMALAAMELATERADESLTALLGATPDPAAAFLAAGVDAVNRAVRRYETGGRLTDDEVAELSLLLASIEVRDEAWSQVGPDVDPLDQSTMELHLRLWTDVVSRACPDAVAPAASLLAYVAWRAGDGTTAGIALNRAFAADPGYSMARLMAEVLDQAIPPSEAGRGRSARSRRRRRPARRRGGRR